VAGGAWLWSGTLRFSAPRRAVAGIGLLSAFALWSAVTLLWSVAPDNTWLELNRVLTYVIVLVLAVVLGASTKRAVGLISEGFVLVATAVTPPRGGDGGAGAAGGAGGAGAGGGDGAAGGVGGAGMGGTATAGDTSGGDGSGGSTNGPQSGDASATAMQSNASPATGGAGGNTVGAVNQAGDALGDGGYSSGGNGGATAAMNTGAASANGGTAIGGNALAAGGPATSGASTVGNFATVGQSSSQTMSGLTLTINWQKCLSGYSPLRV